MNRLQLPLSAAASEYLPGGGRGEVVSTCDGGLIPGCGRGEGRSKLVSAGRELFWSPLAVICCCRNNNRLLTMDSPHLY